MSYTTEQIVWVKRHTKNFNTTCKICFNQTCDTDCTDSNASKSPVMTNDECTKCGCKAWHHENKKFVWEKKKIYVKV